MALETKEYETSCLRKVLHGRFDDENCRVITFCCPQIMLQGFAELSGKLIPGDMLLAVNERCIWGTSFREVITVIRHALDQAPTNLRFLRVGHGTPEKARNRWMTEISQQKEEGEFEVYFHPKQHLGFRLSMGTMMVPIAAFKSLKALFSDGEQNESDLEDCYLAKINGEEVLGCPFSATMDLLRSSDLPLRLHLKSSSHTSTPIGFSPSCSNFYDNEDDLPMSKPVERITLSSTQSHKLAKGVSSARPQQLLVIRTAESLQALHFEERNLMAEVPVVHIPQDAIGRRADSIAAGLHLTSINGSSTIGIPVKETARILAAVQGQGRVLRFRDLDLYRRERKRNAAFTPWARRMPSQTTTGSRTKRRHKDAPNASIFSLLNAVSSLGLFSQTEAKVEVQQWNPLPWPRQYGYENYKSYTGIPNILEELGSTVAVSGDRKTSIEPKMEELLSTTGVRLQWRANDILLTAPIHCRNLGIMLETDYTGQYFVIKKFTRTEGKAQLLGINKGDYIIEANGRRMDLMSEQDARLWLASLTSPMKLRFRRES